MEGITPGTYGSRAGAPDWPRDKRIARRSVIDLSTTLSFVATRNRGELIMNHIQKAATAFVALIITLVGATLVTAPLALAEYRPAVLHHGIASIAQGPAPSAEAPALRRG